jgi:carbon-monoxide dehydrogenase medium subunit
MRLRPFELIQPDTVAEAVDAFGRTDGEAKLIAGGTALVPMIRLGLIRPGRVIALHRVSGFAETRAEQGVLHLGAMVTMAGLHRAPVVRGGWPLLAEAAGRVATPAIRSSATLGGNLGYAEAASDVAPALLCLEALVETAGPGGERSLPITRFFTGFYETALEAGEIVTGVRVPACPPGGISGYVKFCSRSAEDKPLVGVAALLALDPENGRCRDARIALGGAAPTAMRAGGAEKALSGEALSDGAIRAAAEAAASAADPLSDLMGTADYRREMVRVWVRRLLTALRDGGSASARGLSSA